MEYTYPSYFYDFQCEASACQGHLLCRMGDYD